MLRLSGNASSAIVGLVILFFCGWAWSQEPAPGPGVESHPPQGNAESGQQHSEPDQRGTKAAPLFVQVLTGEESEQHPSSDEPESDEKTSLDRWLVRYTGVLAVFTVILALATIWLGLLTRRSARIAERALTELERPYVFVEFEHPGLRTNLDDRKHIIEVCVSEHLMKYSLLNVGKTVALPIEHHQTIAISKRGELPEPLDASPGRRIDTEIFPIGVLIRPEGKHPTFIDMGQRAAILPDWDKVADIPRTHRLYVQGYFRYGDILGGVHILGYCAVYDIVNERFVLIGDDTLNYTKTEKKPKG